MPPKQLRSARAPGHQQIAKSGTAQLSEADKKALLKRFQDLSIPVRSFVSEIFHHAKEARGRLDDDVYGVLYATLEALKDTGGVPPPLVFGVSHFQTGRVEQVRFVPKGVTQLPQGGKFISNHPALNPKRPNSRNQLEE